MNTNIPKIKRFFECLIPVSFCNLHCDYCYVIQENRRKMKMPEFAFPIEHMVRALSRKRLGGTCWFSICGVGETLAPKEILPLVRGILENGHFVNLTNNGTMSRRIDEFCAFPPEFRARLHFSFSLHYLELKKKNLLERFAQNVNKVRAAGCSFLVQINLYDGYMPYWNEIGKFCIEHFGALPQVALTRREGRKFEIFTTGTDANYITTGRKMASPLFDFTVKNFNLRRHEFCYAGDWSGVLNLGTGELSACYDDGLRQNIFRDISAPIKFCAIGKNCRKPYCINSSHFLSLGTIPSIATPTYAELRNRVRADGTEWFRPEMKAFLSQKLADGNTEYTPLKKLFCNVYFSRYWSFPRRAFKKIARELFKR